MTFIPFLPRFREPIRRGTKTMTTRSRPYGEPGETLDSNGFTIRLIRVFTSTARDVAQDFYREEGCSSPEEFLTIWREIHPTLPLDRLVFVHEFEKGEPR